MEICVRISLSLVAAALLSMVVTAAAAVAQDTAAPAAPAAPAAADQPAAAPVTPPNPAPNAASPQPAAPAAADLQSCLEETGDFVTHGRAVSYLIGLTNSCDKRLRCEIFANVSGARGTTLGHTIMMLGAKSTGAGANKTYTMRVKAAGGVAQVSRQCKVM
jgi:hypothetical protein